MGVWGVFVLGLASPFLCQGATALTAQEIMQKTVAKADTANNPRANYVYNKIAITEELDSKGKVTARKEKLIRISSGKGFVVQIMINGKPLPPEELKREQAQVQAEDQRMNDSRVARRNDNWERLLTTDLISRYAFTLAGEQRLNDRPTFMLTFRPRGGKLPVRETSDRFINNLCGTIWVDQEDFEIAKADLRLQSEVTLWGGVLGALRKFDYKVERLRLEDGVWFNWRSRGDFAGRKFLDNMAIRTRVECKDFEKVATRQASSK